MTCKSCGDPLTATRGPVHEEICWPCADMLVDAKLLAETLYGRPFFWDGRSDIAREDFLDDRTGAAWEAMKNARRWSKGVVSR